MSHESEPLYTIIFYALSGSIYSEECIIFAVFLTSTVCGRIFPCSFITLHVYECVIPNFDFSRKVRLILEEIDTSSTVREIL